MHLCDTTDHLLYWTKSDETYFSPDMKEISKLSRQKKAKNVGNE